VLDDGRIAEFDTPLNLFDNPDSIFHSMCDKAGLNRHDIERIQTGVASQLPSLVAPTPETSSIAPPANERSEGDAAITEMDTNRTMEADNALEMVNLMGLRAAAVDGMQVGQAAEALGALQGETGREAQ